MLAGRLQLATIVEKSLGCVEKLVKVLLEAEKPHSRAFAGAIAGATTASPVSWWAPIPPAMLGTGAVREVSRALFDWMRMA